MVSVERVRVRGRSALNWRNKDVVKSHANVSGAILGADMMRPRAYPE